MILILLGVILELQYDSWYFLELLFGLNLFMCWSVCLIFDIQWPLVRVKIEVSSVAPEHVIKHGEHRFPIGLPVDWKSPIRRLRSNQTDQLSLIE
jgi:hypothetical protein